MRVPRSVPSGAWLSKDQEAIHLRGLSATIAPDASHFCVEINSILEQVDELQADVTLARPPNFRSQIQASSISTVYVTDHQDGRRSRTHERLALFQGSAHEVAVRR
jgi:hypothetical protein